MVEGPGNVGPRGFRRSSPPPNGAHREHRSPQELQRLIKEGLERAEDELKGGAVNEAAVSFSRVARKCMVRARIGDRAAALKWVEESIKPRMKAIDLFHKVRRPIDEARDRSFLGKAFSRLGVMQKDRRLLARAVFERTLAFEMFRELGLVKQQAEELSYLADDFRAMGWLETNPQIRRYIFLKACDYSKLALEFYPRFLIGEELEGRRLHEKSFIALAMGCAALCVEDQTEILAARDKCRSLADQLMECGSDRAGCKLKETARALDALLVSLSFSVSP